jgi:hypothetical protein
MPLAGVRRSALVIAVVAGGALAAAPARAGTYDVVACDAAPHGANGSWVGTSTSSALTAPTTCPTNRAPENGMAARAKVDAGLAPTFAVASQTFEAPAGTSIVSLSTQFSLHRRSAYWRVGLFADGRMLTGCEPDDGSPCFYSTAWPGVTRTFAFAQGVHRVSAQIECGRQSDCNTAPAGQEPFVERAGVRVYAATVRVRDDSVPTVADTHTGLLTSGGWQRGARAIGYSAGDNVGIRATRFFVDGRQRDDLAPACDFSRRVPCPDLPSSRFVLETQALADGAHQLRVDAVDTAGNVAHLVRSFATDNTPPNAPEGVAVEGGEGWRSANGFRVGWRNPASASPIVGAHYEVCPVGGGACVTGERRGQGIQAIGDVRVPEPGDYTARVWVEDAAGNVDYGARSAPVHLRFDDVAPGKAEPRDREGWLRESALDEPIAMGEGQLVPLSGIGGYSVTTDGSDPDATVDTQGGSYPLDSLPEGVTRLRARAVSGSGVASPYVGEVVLRVDRTAPVAAVAGAPDPGDWQRRPVALALRGSDQPGLSGITPAPPGEPLESGGYLEWRVDGATAERAAGDAADVTLAGDGAHTVVFHAVDVAGNQSPPRTVVVRIDGSAPELVAFERGDPRDPRAIAVDVADRTSGVAGGVVELRRAGRDDAWRALPTALRGGRLVARFDDATPAGTYLLRARVRDRAGNEAIGDRRRDGAPMVVDTGRLRSTTRLAAGMASAGRGSRSGSLAAATVGYGRRAEVRGTLARASGAPVAGGAVEVWSRPAAAGSSYQRVARVTTDAAGGFRYVVPAGTSRTLRFRFAGSALDQPSHAEVRLRVPASVTIAASRRSVRNGQAVTFSGRLRGRPIPAAGKVLDLQAHYRGRWRTFATPRAARDGRWRYAYRFGATRGRLVYPFRVVVRPESSYPYEQGVSRTVKVTVTGRALTG